MSLILKLRLDNDAFHPEPQGEVARILRELAKRVEDNFEEHIDIPVRDINGNTTGRFILDFFPEPTLHEEDC